VRLTRCEFEVLGEDLRRCASVGRCRARRTQTERLHTDAACCLPVQLLAAWRVCFTTINDFTSAAAAGTSLPWRQIGEDCRRWWRHCVVYLYQSTTSQTASTLYSVVAMFTSAKHTTFVLESNDKFIVGKKTKNVKPTFYTMHYNGRRLSIYLFAAHRRMQPVILQGSTPLFFLPNSPLLSPSVYHPFYFPLLAFPPSFLIGTLYLISSSSFPSLSCRYLGLYNPATEPKERCKLPAGLCGAQPSNTFLCLRTQKSPIYWILGGYCQRSLYLFILQLISLR